jgi:hypothetical protein
MRSAHAGIEAYQRGVSDEKLADQRPAFGLRGEMTQRGHGALGRAKRLNRMGLESHAGHRQDQGLRGALAHGVTVEICQEDEALPAGCPRGG